MPLRAGVDDDAAEGEVAGQFAAHDTHASAQQNCAPELSDVSSQQQPLLQP